MPRTSRCLGSTEGTDRHPQGEDGEEIELLTSTGVEEARQECRSRRSDDSGEIPGNRNVLITLFRPHENWKDRRSGARLCDSGYSCRTTYLQVGSNLSNLSTLVRPQPKLFLGRKGFPVTHGFASDPCQLTKSTLSPTPFTRTNPGGKRVGVTCLST